MYTFQDMVAKLSDFWRKQGVAILQPHDVEKGAATFNPHTFFRCLGPEPFHAAYIEPCRRPKDGRYAQTPNRTQHYFQYQVILKPSPYNIQELYLQSLEAIGFHLNNHDIRFVHDDWEQPTIGAWGLGWEVWIDGQECTQFTYFQAVAGISLQPITGEITYGLERLALYLQNKQSFFDLQWNDTLTYGDLYRQNEIEWSHYNFTTSDPRMWLTLFEQFGTEAKKLSAQQQPIPALDCVMKASHAFNMLDARGALSVTQRAAYMADIRNTAKLVAESYLASREQLGYPLCHKSPPQLSSLAPIPVEHSEHRVHEKAQDFLLEIGTEELPASFIPLSIERLTTAMRVLLDKEQLTYLHIESFGTPRRLGVIVHGLSPEKKQSTQEKKGPSLAVAFTQEGKITPAAEGFFKQLGLFFSTREEALASPVLSVQEIKGTDYLFARITSPSRKTQIILEEQLANIILGLDFPKKMRWADVSISFARPIRWIAALFGEETLSFSVGPITSSRYTFGHRQLAPNMHALHSATTYKKELQRLYVMADPEERKTSILEQLNQLEKTHGVIIGEREKILPQVIHLVEYPFLTMTHFDQHFLRAPQEVLISEMCEHQKYFPVFDSAQKLQPQFVITANIPATASIEQGNRNVLSARLSDGVFLFEQDLKTPLEQFTTKLKDVQFQNGLGTMYDKVIRLQHIVRILQPFVAGADLTAAEEAAYLCKADLVTEVVQEFPELQGVMGRIYAVRQGKSAEVADAIDAHWMPRGEKAPIPHTKTGTLVALAEKFDNLISFFGLGLKPTSSSDPFALRRQAFGLIKIIVKNALHIPLLDIINRCMHFFPKEFQERREEIAADILSFIQQRYRSHLVDEKHVKGHIEACLPIRKDDLFDIYLRLQALDAFSAQHMSFPQLVEVYKRCRGQITSEEKYAFEQSLCSENAEIALSDALEHRKLHIYTLIHTCHYEEMLHSIAELQPFLSKLFDTVRILADDPAIRRNRIALLQEVSALFHVFADFQKI